MPKNVEIKARCQQIDQIRTILENRQADFKGIDHQIDTYFNVPQGRMKLREGNIENNLIHYLRSDQAGPKTSTVTLYQSQPDSSLKILLAQALGVMTTVDKKRAIYYLKNVKFHLDEVEQLGNFVEIEAIDTDGSISEATLLEQCQYYLDLFQIKAADLIENSYSDLILQHG
ncbi:MAG: class IV adenylate cyclase [Saprospiraceae bacterium]